VWTRAVAIVSGLALLVFLLLTTRLGALERGGPARADVALEGGVPATFYLPQEGDAWAAFLDPPPRGERPPAVVLMHGFASDRLFSSSVARRLAGAGYAVLAIDATGHGENRNPFRRSFGRPDFFEDDLAAAVGFLRTSPQVDGARIAVMGHSMGAGAALDYATRDSGIDAAVMIAGGWTIQGPYTPPNALFIYAERDPEPIRARARELAARIAGVEPVEVGRTYGRFEKGTAVRAYEVAGTDHGRIVWQDETLREIVHWLDASFGRPETAQIRGDPRLGVAGMLGLAIVLVLPGLGLVVGRLAPRGMPLASDGRAVGLLALAAALLALLPLFSVGSPGAILSVEVGDVIVPYLALVGIALLTGRALVGAPDAGVFQDWRRTALAAGVGLVGVYCLMFPLGVVVHRMTLTPERMLVFAASTAALLPFALAVQVLLRRGPPLTAGLFSLAGRVLVLVALVVGVALGVIERVVMLMVGPLALLALMAELLATSIYAASRNLGAIALIDAAWLAFVVASSMPVRL
jgi:dienelactone hydrolase